MNRIVVGMAIALSASFTSCQSVVQRESFELVDVLIEGATPESIDRVEVSLRPGVTGNLEELALNFGTSESFDRTVAYRRMTGTGGVSTGAQYEDIRLSPPTNELWLQLKVRTTDGQQEERRFRVF